MADGGPSIASLAIQIETLTAQRNVSNLVKKVRSMGGMSSDVKGAADKFEELDSAVTKATREFKSLVEKGVMPSADALKKTHAVTTAAEKASRGLASAIREEASEYAKLAKAKQDAAISGKQAALAKRVSAVRGAEDIDTLGATDRRGVSAGAIRALGQLRKARKEAAEETIHDAKLLASRLEEIDNKHAQDRIKLGELIARRRKTIEKKSYTDSRNMALAHSEAFREDARREKNIREKQLQVLKERTEALRMNAKVDTDAARRKIASDGQLSASQEKIVDGIRKRMIAGDKLRAEEASLIKQVKIKIANNRRLSASEQRLAQAIDRTSAASKANSVAFIRLGKSVQKMQQTIARVRNAMLVYGFAIRMVIDPMVRMIRKAAELEKGMAALTSVGRRLGISQAALRQSSKDLTKDGLLNVAQASLALSRLLSTGIGLPKATQLLKAFKDAAVFGGQGTRTLNQNLIVAIDGFRNFMSRALDNIGITKNASVIMAEYGRSIGKSVQSMSELEKHQALANGLIKEAEIFSGNAQLATKNLSGQVERLANAWDLFSASAGRSGEVKGFIGALADTFFSLAESIDEFNQTPTEKILAFLEALPGAENDARLESVRLRYELEQLQKVFQFKGPENSILSYMEAAGRSIVNLLTLGGAGLSENYIGETRKLAQLQEDRRRILERAERLTWEPEATRDTVRRQLETDIETFRQGIEQQLLFYESARDAAVSAAKFERGTSISPFTGEEMDTSRQLFGQELDDARAKAAKKYTGRIKALTEAYSAANAAKRELDQTVHKPDAESKDPKEEAARLSRVAQLRAKLEQVQSKRATEIARQTYSVYYSSIDQMAVNSQNRRNELLEEGRRLLDASIQSALTARGKQLKAELSAAESRAGTEEETILRKRIATEEAENDFARIRERGVKHQEQLADRLDNSLRQSNEKRLQRAATVRRMEEEQARSRMTDIELARNNAEKNILAYEKAIAAKGVTEAEAHKLTIAFSDIENEKLREKIALIKEAARQAEASFVSGFESRRADVLNAQNVAEGKRLRQDPSSLIADQRAEEIARIQREGEAKKARERETVVHPLTGETLGRASIDLSAEAAIDKQTRLAKMEVLNRKTTEAEIARVVGEAQDRLIQENMARSQRAIDEKLTLQQAALENELAGMEMSQSEREELYDRCNTVLVAEAKRAAEEAGKHWEEAFKPDEEVVRISAAQAYSAWASTFSSLSRVAKDWGNDTIGEVLAVSAHLVRAAQQIQKLKAMENMMSLGGLGAGLAIAAGIAGVVSGLGKDTSPDSGTGRRGMEVGGTITRGPQVVNINPTIVNQADGGWIVYSADGADVMRQTIIDMVAESVDRGELAGI